MTEVARVAVVRPVGRRELLRWWDLAAITVVLVLAAVAALDVLGGERSGMSLSGYVSYRLAVLLTFALLYTGLGRSALVRALRGRRAKPIDHVFLGLLIIFTGVAIAVEPWFAIFQAIVFPVIWTIIQQYRNAVAVSAGLALTVGAGVAVAYSGLGVGNALVPAALNTVLAFIFAIAMGTWITRIFHRSEQHRLIAEQLRQAQAEVAALSLEAGAAAERERLSRDLHDTLTQTLTGLVMLSEQSSRALDAGAIDHARDRLDRVQSAARDAVAEARALVATTQPLGEGGLVASLRRVTSRLQQDTGLLVECEFGEEASSQPTPAAPDTVVLPTPSLMLVPLPALSREDEVVMLRAAQEGLANARKHARASRVTVRLFAEPGAVRGAPAENTADAVILQVEDDGVGINMAVGSETGETPSGRDAEYLEQRGFGLSGLVDRVSLAGGTVSVGPAPSGRGTLLEVRLVTEVRIDSSVGG